METTFVGAGDQMLNKEQASLLKLFFAAGFNFLLRRLAKLRHRELVKFVELALQQFLVGQGKLVFRNQRGRQGTVQRILHDLAVLAGAEQHADGRTFVGLAHVAVEGFEIEIHFAELLRLKFFDLEVERDQALQPAMIEQQVEREVRVADLQAQFLADETKIRAEFDEEFFEVGHERRLQLPLGMFRGQVQKIQQVGVFENGFGGGMQLSQHC